MRLGKRAFLWSALASLALVAAACSDVSSSSTAAGGGTVPDNSGTTVNFSISPWDGSAANVAVAEYLLKNQLGYSVGDKDIDEYAQFKALANGDLDATLEVWPSGHAADYKKYIATDNGVVDYDDSVFTGQYQYWSGCGTNGSEYVVLVANPSDASYTAVIAMQILSDADWEALDQAFATFNVVTE